MLQNKTNKDIVLKYGKSFSNTGCSEVQIAILTKKINHLQSHFSIHKKDHCSRKGLLKIVSKRRKLLNYLKIKNYFNYNNIISLLKIRK
ncbi:30S ribosomal protein S15 [Buchnera aphidicola]|uniref:30S ribosomal protein S15 n=1 Tax=Buchnera aphidicola TaxID=9 RepID=UPI0030EB69CF